jgi:hypothetical protein
VTRFYRYRCKIEAAAAAVSPTTWAGLAMAAERTAREMNPQNVANSLNALNKLEMAAAAVSPSGWMGLAEAAKRTAREMEPQDVAISLNALMIPDNKRPGNQIEET